MVEELSKGSEFYKLVAKKSDLAEKSKKTFMTGITITIILTGLVIWMYVGGNSDTAKRIMIYAAVFLAVVAYQGIAHFRMKRVAEKLGVNKYAKLSESEKQLIEGDIASGRQIGDIVLGEKYVYASGILFDFFAYRDIVWIYEIAYNKPAEDGVYTVKDKKNSAKSAVDILYKGDSEYYAMHIEFYTDDISVQEILDIVAEKNPAVDIGYSDEKRDHYKSYVESRRK